MVGGFSYPLSQLNRTTQALRQPGSSIKPLTYLAALHSGLQPNTLVHGPAGHAAADSRRHARTPGRRRTTTAQAAGTITLRRALENSKNLVTARLLDGGIDKDPTKSLEQICDLALQAKIYPECMKNYPFVLGAQALRMIDLAGVLRRDRQRRPARHALRHRLDRAERPAGLSPSDAGAPVMLARRRPRRVLPAAHHPRRRGDARHRSLDEASGRLRRRQDRHHRQRERRLVRRLHQRRHRRGLGRLRQRPRQAHARPRRHRRPASRCRSSSRSSRPAWNLHVAPKTPLPPPSAEAARHLKTAADRRRQRPDAVRPANSGFHGVFPARRPKEAARHPAMRWSAASRVIARSSEGRPAPAPNRGARPPAAGHGGEPACTPPDRPPCRGRCGSLFGL